jgi:LCP family protein required for cell wall assembly
MKKTLLFMGFITALTVVLFYSGLNLLAMVERVDPIGALSAIAENANLDFLEDAIDDLGWANTGVSEGYGDKSEEKSPASDRVITMVSPKNTFLDVLRDFKQNAGDPINVLLLAGDKGGNTDAIMVAHIDPKTVQANILSIPRDTYITVSGSSNHKINSIYKSKDGANKLKKTLEKMLSQPIDYYVYLDLETIRSIVDLLDGVEYDVPCDMKYTDPDQKLQINLKKGRQTLTGKQVEGLLRFRKPDKWTSEVRKHYDGSDIKRIERQHDFFKEMLDQKLSIKYITKANGIIDTVYSSIKTDMPLQEMLKVAKCLPSLSQEKLVAVTLPGTAKTINSLSYYIHSEKQSRAIAATMLADSPPPPPPPQR